MWGGGILAFLALVFVGLVLPSISPSQAVASGATPSPAVTAPAPGYVEPDMGRGHEVDPNAKIRYTWCPPASGRHYNIAGSGPIKGGFYGQNDKTSPGGWVHNLEHGAIALLYKCPGDGCTDAGQSALEALLARWPDSPICKIPPGNLTPVITRFDDMPYPYAAVVWGMVLPLQTLDEAAIFSFYAAYGEQFNPEKQCPVPTATPAPPTPTSEPASPSPEPASAAPATSAAPAAS
jgi:hypothetical protein